MPRQITASTQPSPSCALEARGIPVFTDIRAATLPQNFPMSDCAFYLGWYTGNADGPFLNPAFRLRRGAVACHIQSFSAATLKSDKLNWCGPLVAHGACGTLGNVFEPYLPLTANLDIFTDRLLAGYTLAEAGWASTQVLSWMSVVIGDPLYRPFAVAPGDGDKNVAADYKALRLAAQRWGKPEDAAELTANLMRAAESLKSPVIYEFLALRAQSGDAKAWPAAKKCYDLAMQFTKDSAGQMRLTFLMADALHRAGENKVAALLLKPIVEKIPAVPEAAAAKAWLQEMGESK